MADRYWVNAAADNDFSNSANWSTSSGGAGGASVPGSSDVAIFDSAVTDSCSYLSDSALSLYGLELRTGYTGTVSFPGAPGGGEPSVTIGLGGFLQQAGTLSATAGTMTLNLAAASGSWVQSGGTFTHNSGTVVFSNTGINTITITMASDLNNVSIIMTGAASSIIMASAVNVRGTFNLTMNGSDLGKWNLYGNVGGWATSALSAGAISLLGTSVCAFTNTAGSRIPSCTINKTAGGSVTFANNFDFVGSSSFIHTAGTVTLPNTFSIVYNSAASMVVNASALTFNNVVINTTGGSTNLNINTMNISGKLLITSSTNTTGTANVSGDLESDTATAGGALVVNLVGATACTLKMNGTRFSPTANLTINKTGTVTLGENFAPPATWTGSTTLTAGTVDLSSYQWTVRNKLTINGGVFNCNTGSLYVLYSLGTGEIEINGGELQLGTSQSHDIRGIWDYNGGTITPGTSRVQFYAAVGSEPVNVYGTFTLNKVWLRCAATGSVHFYINIYDTLTVDGLLEVTGYDNTGWTCFVRGNGTIVAKGNVTWINSSGIFGTAGDGVNLTIGGTSTQTITGLRFASNGTVKVDKPSGTAVFSGTTSFGRNNTSNGIQSDVIFNPVTACDFSTNAVTCFLYFMADRDITISNPVTFWNLQLLGTAGTGSSYASLGGNTITVANTTTISLDPATNDRKIQNGTLDMKGDLSLTISSGSLSYLLGTALLKFSGSADAVWTSTLSGTYNFNNITIAKDAGKKVTLAALLQFDANTLTVSSGIMVLDGFDVTVENFVISAGAELQCDGSETITVGTAKTLAATSTVRFVDDAVTAVIDQIAITFGNIVLGDDKTHQITAGATITVNGALGSDGTNLTPSLLRSATDGVAWLLDLVGTSTLANKVDVKDSDASAGKTVLALGSADNGNNVNWAFLDTNRFFVGAVDDSWADTGNWSWVSGGTGGASVPDATKEVFLDASSPDCTVDVASAAVLNLDCSAFTNTLSLAGNLITCHGTAWVFSTGMTFTATGGEIAFSDGVVTTTIAFAGKTVFDLTLGKNRTHTIVAGLLSGVQVDGTLSSNGTLTDRAILRSTAPGVTQWYINLQGTADLTNRVDVQDSNASAGLQIDALGSLNSGNNINWFFGGSGGRSDPRSMGMMSIGEGFTGGMFASDFLAYAGGGGYGGMGGQGGAGGGAPVPALTYTIFVAGLTNAEGSYKRVICGWNASTSQFDKLIETGAITAAELGENGSIISGLASAVPIVTYGSGLPVSAFTAGAFPAGIAYGSVSGRHIHKRGTDLVALVKVSATNAAFVYSSSDGINWSVLGNTINTGETRSLYNLSSGTLLAHVDTGGALFRSVNAGVAWTTPAALTLGKTGSFSESPAGRIFTLTDASTFGAILVQYSDDDGATWTNVVVAALPADWADRNTGVLGLALSNTRLLCSYQATGLTAYAALMLSTDGGANWSQVFVETTADTYVVDLWKDASGDLFALLGSTSGYTGGRIITSTDNGATWADWFARSQDILGPGATAASPTAYCFSGALR